DVSEVKTRMKLVNRTAIRERKPGHTFAERDATTSQFLNILSRHVSRCSVAFVLVVKVNDARVERNDVAHLVDEDLERVLDVQRRAKRAGNLIQRINFTVRLLDLIVSDVRAALTRLTHINFAELNRRLG